MNVRDPLPPRDVLTPTSLNRLARELLENAFPMIWVEGELSNVSKPASGHLYFTLKDARSQVRCALFRHRAFGLKARPADGMQVLLRAQVSLYEGRGEFQLIVEHLEEAGAGALRRTFDQLKEKLQAEGLFATERKRTVPHPPRRLGVITSASGAAIRDVLNVLARRFPLLPVDILPVPVQGTESAPAIIAMLDAAARSGRYDALLLTRGGGSLEDLWSFNEEAVARAIAACPVPVVSAVGHEVDVTIADLVADLRAPTPSAAAEMLVPDGAALLARLSDTRLRLARAQRRWLDNTAQRSDALYLRLKNASPQTRLQVARVRLDSLSTRLVTFLPTRLKTLRHQLLPLEQRIHHGILRGTELRRRRLDDLARTLHAISPLATLERGYAILLERESGAVIRHTNDAPPGMRLIARLSDGTLPLRVEDP